MTADGSSSVSEPPLWLLAELTYRCPLHCVFCSNPLDYTRHTHELTTAEWVRVFREARGLGSVQLGLSGGEPLQRDDLEELVAEAHRLGYYTNLSTSGAGLTEARAQALRTAGLAHIQLSLQDSTRTLNDFLTSTRTFEQKSRVARILRDQGYPLVLSCVMHRYNLPHLGRIIQMAEDLGARSLELVHAQYHGWAWLNREALRPTPAELADAEAIAEVHKARLQGRMRVLWGSVGRGAFLRVAPDGTTLPGRPTPNVRTSGVQQAWLDTTRLGSGEQPLRFVAHAARQAGLVYRSDDNSRMLSPSTESPPC